MKAEAETSVRPARRWGLWLALAGATLAVLGGGVWLLRLPIAEFTFRSVLAQHGVDADADVLELDWTGLLARNIRLGGAAAPDAAAELVQLRWRWDGFSPRLAAVRVVKPCVHVSFDAAGRMSAGSLDHLQGGPAQPGARPTLPALDLDIGGGEARIDAPFGATLAHFEGQGVLGSTFHGAAWIAPTTATGGGYAVDKAHAELRAVSQNGALALQLTAAADALAWDGVRLSDAALLATARAPLDLSRAEADLGWQITAIAASGNVAAQRFDGRAHMTGALRNDALALANWSGDLTAQAALLAQADARAKTLRLEAHAQGEGDRARGDWNARATRFDGFSLTAPEPSASGDFALAGEQFDLRGALTLAHARLTEDAQDALRTALPDAEGAPVGPAFTQARRALDAAMDDFGATAPFALQWESGQGRAVVAAPFDARAANGVRLHVTPLRDDAPTLTAQLPQASVHGAVAIELSGGGAPHATLLLDSVDWAPDAALEADGSLSLDGWRAGASSISAQNLDLSLEAKRLNVKGGLLLSGPLGDGGVRNLNMDLDIAVGWDRGWRITPNHQCVPATLAGMDVAGLSFQNGAFRFCAAQNGALIAADPQGRLSGGFVIQALDLNGHMAPPDSQPARLRSGSVHGVFSGRGDDITLNIEAVAPDLSIAMAPDRTLSVRGERVTANARVTDHGWRIDGAFVSGLLADPTLPGDVSAIAGRWSAAPVEDRAAIRVEAGEARIIARPPPPDAADTRPAFNPIRLADVAALVDQGDITANGRIVLEKGAHDLARFTAVHHVDAGQGEAHVIADALTFDQNFQPYEITELARGLIDNVRGTASATADFAWTHDTMTATGHVRPNGISLAMSTIPVIEDVRGDVYFDDLLMLTTPPGQTLSVGMINPGIVVRNGRLRFQLLPEQRVAIEQAAFDFAGGTLAVAPTTIALGSEETRFELTLSDVDVATLLAQMDFKDLQATGRVEGSFPLLLTTRTALIQNGVLRAAPGGGSISYVGNAGQAASGGAAGVAFDALKSFHYDNLNVTLNGDISGDVVTALHFTGFNTGRAVDLGPISPVPGVGRLHARGVPFRFSVTVTAPFRRLMESAATITNPQSLLHQAEPVPATPPVDQTPSAPR